MPAGPATDAVIVARDLSALATTIGEIEIDLQYAGHALYTAFEDGDPVGPVLHNLRKARDELDAVISELEAEARR